MGRLEEPPGRPGELGVSTAGAAHKQCKRGREGAVGAQMKLELGSGRT